MSTFRVWTIVCSILFSSLEKADGLRGGADVDRYAVTWTTASQSSLGAMPLGNGRVSANTWVDVATGDLMLNIGLADAFDENSNLLKVGLVRVQLDPPINGVAVNFNQTLVLSTATIEIQADDVTMAVWVDANTSDVRVSVTPSTARRVVVVLDHETRLNSTINAGAFGNGWGGSGGSFCNANGTIADFVGIFPDVLHPSNNSVVWYHRNDRARSDMYNDAMIQQGLGSCGSACWDPLTNRSWGAALVGDSSFTSINQSSLGTKPIAETVELGIAVISAQTPTVTEFVAQLDALVVLAKTHLVSPTQRRQHETWWRDFYNRSYFHVVTNDTDSHNPKNSATDPQGYKRLNNIVGDQLALIRNADWPAKGESPGNCTQPFNVNSPSEVCVAKAAAMCDQVKNCCAFALDRNWHEGFFPQLYTDVQGSANSGWALFINTTNLPPTPPPPPPLSKGFIVSRQNILMRYMDVCSSGRIGGGTKHEDFFALKYNGGILTSESAPKMDYRAWGPGQWWQNLRLPYYAMLAEGGADLFKPLLRWYLALLPMAKRRTELWFNRTDAAGRDLTGVHGAFFHETHTQFGTMMPSEKGYHCTAVRDTNWTVDWGGNIAINLHREGSVEVLMLGLDYFDHTLDEHEFEISILPLSVAVTDFVSSYYGRDPTTGELNVWPTQSLEGFRPGGFPPTRNNTIQNDMPWVAGLHAVLPRLISVGSILAVAPSQIQKWKRLLQILPPLPMASSAIGGSIEDSVAFGGEKFTAAQTPYPPEAILGGSEHPYMYAVHPYRLSTVMNGGSLHTIGLNTIGCADPNCSFSDGTGWYQGVMNVALLGLGKQAAAAVYTRAATPNSEMRFPAYLPSMQDFRPNEDHLSNMRSALQYMMLQHSDTNSTIGLFPAWSCDQWSASFKLHAPAKTILEGHYDHVARKLFLSVDPIERTSDIVLMGCVNVTDVTFAPRSSWAHLI